MRSQLGHHEARKKKETGDGMRTVAKQKPMISNEGIRKTRKKRNTRKKQKRREKKSRGEAIALKKMGGEE